MKNLKNMIAAMSLMAVLGFGAVSANAGLMISDRNANAQPSACGSVKGGALDGLAGVSVVGAPLLDGVIILGREGVIVLGREGVIVLGREGC